MTSSYIQKAGTELLKKHLEDYSTQDPLYEYYTDSQGNEHHRKRAIPPGLSPRDIKILKSVQRRAHFLDKGFSVCGFRFGWSFIIGIIPGAGDVVDATLNYYLVVRKARQADLPASLVRRMLFNNAVSALAGLVPLVGDVVIAVFKANSKNAALLEEFLRIRGQTFLRLQAEEEQRMAESLPRNASHHENPGAGTSDGAATTPSQPGSRFSSWTRASRKKKQVVPSPGEKGKFVEDVEPTAVAFTGRAKTDTITMQRR